MQYIIRGGKEEKVDTKKKEKHLYLKGEKKRDAYDVSVISIQISNSSTRQQSQLLTFLVILKYAVIRLISIIFRRTIVA